MDFLVSSVVSNVLEVSTITTVLVFLCSFLVIFLNTRRRQGVPPGPPLFPVIGNLPSLLGSDIFENLKQLRQRYGDIFGVYIGGDLTIFLNGYDVIHDALVKQGSQFVNRPRDIYYNLVIKNSGIVAENGEIWKETRSFVSSSFRDLCFKEGGKDLEQIINTEIASLVDDLSKTDEALDIEHCTTVSITNVIFMLVFRHRFGFEDEKLKTILNCIEDGIKEHAKMLVLVSCFPFLTRLPGDVLKAKGYKRRLAFMRNAVKPYIDTIKENNENRKCVYGLYLNRVENAHHKHIKNSITAQRMVDTCNELLGAASDTTATTLRWIILYLIQQPNIQNKMFEEIVRTIGQDRMATLKDKPRLVYVQAVILEGMRMAAALPLAIPHTTARDLSFHGYIIPENSTVVVNLNSCTKDHDVWKEPEVFRPERFLREDETEIFVPKAFIPFSCGPRSCPGESLVRMELFLFLTALVQKFEFQPATAGCFPSSKGNFGMTWYPNRFLLKLKKRELI